MRNTTLASLRSQTRQRADIENDDHIGSDELDLYINQSLTYLTDVVVRSNEDYMVSVRDYALVASSSSYAQPTDFYKPLRLDLDDGNGMRMIRPFQRDDKPALDRSSAYSPWFDTCYRMQGSSIVLSPPPTTGGTLRLTYVPTLATLTGSNDVFDGVNGWEELVVVDAAIKCVQKQDRDVSVLFSQRTLLENRVKTMVAGRVTNEAPRILDRNDDWDALNVPRRWRWRP